MSLALLISTYGSFAEELCDRLERIERIPMKGDGTDAVYLEMLEAGDSLVPCLIDRLTDESPMRDPRSAPSWNAYAVGDTAQIMLVLITGREFAATLPRAVQADWVDNGVYAYFDYVSEPVNRRRLQEKWRAWQADQR